MTRARLGALIVLFALVTSAVASAQEPSAYFRYVRTIETARAGVPAPVGLTFSPVANAFLLPGASGATPTASGTAKISMINLFGDAVGAVSVAAPIVEPLNAAFDSRAHRLVFFDRAAGELVAVRALPAGYPTPSRAAVARFGARPYGVQNPQGMTFDPASGRLFILDAATWRILAITPHPVFGFDGATALRDGRVRPISLHRLPQGAPLRGLAFNPGDGHLYVSSPLEQTLYELNEAGQVLSTRDLSALPLGDSQAMVFAPSGDSTDDPSQMSLYIADSGQTDAVIELSFIQPAAPAVASFASTLVRTVDASRWSPPSPDASGITYLNSSNTLLVSDCEVEEIVGGITHFQGVNLWEITLNGTVVRTANISKVAPTVVPMTNEPT